MAVVNPKLRSEMAKQKSSFRDQLGAFCSVPWLSKTFILLLTLVTLLLGENHTLSAQIIQPLQSKLRPGEIDTADRPGGQAGGIQMGSNYRLMELRCGTGEAIVGAQIRRGDVLDFMQVACARPNCGNRGCRWEAQRWGPGAGGQAGDPHPPMLCGQTEIVSGFRARVVTFTRFDYAADIEIECARLTGPPSPQGFFPVGEHAGWHHPEGALREERSDQLSRGRSAVTPAISCRPAGFGITAISVGESSFVNTGQRVLQAISLYCPAARPGPRCPENLVVLSREDQYELIRNRWFSQGGRTGGGILVEMRAQPESQNWAGIQISETLRLGPQTCNLPNQQAQAICGTGGHPVFTIGTDRSFSVGTIQINWDHPVGGQNRNSFPDLHLVLDNAGGAPAQWNLLDNVLGGKANSCQITCLQTYACGGRTYGTFEITYSCTRDTFVRPGTFLQPGAQVGVTRVTATKR